VSARQFTERNVCRGGDARFAESGATRAGRPMRAGCQHWNSFAY
jgi:hypothetical protein